MRSAGSLLCLHRQGLLQFPASGPARQADLCLASSDEQPQMHSESLGMTVGAACRASV